jgi:ATP-dependent RNA helicase DHX29
VWAKAQDISFTTYSDNAIDVVADSTRFSLTMTGVATPDAKQSEAYAATCALFHIFGGSPREEKVGLKLPPTWRDLWTELAESKKSELDALDRTVVGGLRTLVRQRQDQELEDGVILASAFRGRGTTKPSNESSDSKNQDRAKQSNGHADLYRKIWADKSREPRFQQMLVRPQW